MREIVEGKHDLKQDSSSSRSQEPYAQSQELFICGSQFKHMAISPSLLKLFFLLFALEQIKLFLELKKIGKDDKACVLR